jgi:hypothetical protein
MIGTKIIVSIFDKTDLVKFIQLLVSNNLWYGIDYTISYEFNHISSDMDFTRSVIFYFKKSKNGIWFSLLV